MVEQVMVLCKVCHRAIATTRAGLIRVHGPVHNRCPGSYCSPATPTLTSSASSTFPATTGTSSSASSTSHTTSASTAISNTADNQSSANIGVSGESRPHLIPLVDPLPPRCVSKVIKRIPRVCRDRAAAKLASILETVCSLNDHASIVSSITNSHLTYEDHAWTQATLPVKYGGLGIGIAAQLAPSAFLASAAGSSDLVHQLLPSNLQGTQLLHVAEGALCGHSYIASLLLWIPSLTIKRAGIPPWL